MRKLVLVGGVAVVLAGLGLWFLGRPAYRHFKERRAMTQAREFAGNRQQMRAGCVWQKK